MAFPAPDVYAEADQTLSLLCDALGYPARVELIRLLTDRDMYVNELVRKMPLSQSAVSDHLRKLRTSGLIEVEVQGLYNKYSFDIGQLEGVRARLDALIAELKNMRSGVEGLAGKPAGDVAG